VRRVNNLVSWHNSDVLGRENLAEELGLAGLFLELCLGLDGQLSAMHAPLITESLVAQLGSLLHLLQLLFFALALQLCSQLLLCEVLELLLVIALPVAWAVVAALEVVRVHKVRLQLCSLAVIALHVVEVVPAVAAVHGA